MRLRQGDIVLIPVPFTDLSSRKRRPVVVISTDTYNAAGLDMVVVAMTSNPTQTTWSFVISSADMMEGISIGRVRCVSTRSTRSNSLSPSRGSGKFQT